MEERHPSFKGVKRLGRVSPSLFWESFVGEGVFTSVEWNVDRRDGGAPFLSVWSFSGHGTLEALTDLDGSGE